MKNIEKRWKEAIRNPLLNTSYPVHRQHWFPFRTKGTLPFNEPRAAFYIHIPFCPHLCKFCEYTRMQVPGSSSQFRYLETLRRDMECFAAENRDIELHGFDIGGGTPTVLSPENFNNLMDSVDSMLAAYPVSSDIEPSIESTFATITPEKAKRAVQSGFRRISFGLQSSDPKLLKAFKRRADSLSDERSKMDIAYSAGVEKINLDLMYGLSGQKIEGLKADLEAIAFLMPEQVTLYEWRTNQIGARPANTPEELFSMYSTMYEGLRSLGYHADFGQNTFTTYPNDFGCSSYIRKRMREALPYKGFGISSQSMSSAGLSYNIGKGSTNLPLDAQTFENGDTYLLPPPELAAKAVAISGYHGSLSISALSRILGEDAREYYAPVISFCFDRGMLIDKGDRLALTAEGFLHYGAVFSLFYPESAIC